MDCSRTPSSAALLIGARETLGGQPGPSVGHSIEAAWPKGRKMGGTRRIVGSRSAWVSTGPTAQLAAFVADLTLDDLPARIKERVKDLTLDALASALAGQQ